MVKQYLRYFTQQFDSRVKNRKTLTVTGYNPTTRKVARANITQFRRIK